MKKLILCLLLVLVLFSISMPVTAASSNRMVGVNVILNTEVTDAILDDLGTHGVVRDVIYEIHGVTLKARIGELDEIQALPYVSAANPDTKRSGAPVDTVEVDNFTDGWSTWNLDAINVTDIGDNNRQVDFDGAGVYVAVLDTGLLDSWRQYFPEDRIAVEYGKCFGGGGGEVGYVSEQPQKWQHDQDSHGTHVTSTIIGYNMGGTPVNGVAPMATIIPVKVLNQNGFGWSSVIARGIVYIAELKAGPLADYPVVINMSMGGPESDSMEEEAIDYAISQGVIIVASAGNNGEAGMIIQGPTNQ